jgi:hypothetical protein
LFGSSDGFRQPLRDGEVVAVGRQRAPKVALRHLHIAGPAVRRRQLRCQSGCRIQLNLVPIKSLRLLCARLPNLYGNAIAII